MKCKRCNGELTHDDKRDCDVCLTCYPPQKKKPKEEEKNRDQYIDIPLTPEQEKRIRVIVRDELENWHIPKDIDDDISAKPERLSGILNPDYVHEVEVGVQENWRAQAKGFGIPLSQSTGGARKKVDVIADIEAKLKESNE